MSTGPEGLQRLAEERENILLAEIAALLHDIGKFCDRHVEVHSMEEQVKTPPPEFEHKLIIEDPKSIFSLVATTADTRDNNQRLFNELQHLRNVIGENVAGYFTSKQKQVLKDEKIQLLGENHTISEMIFLGRPGLARPSLLKAYLGKDAWLIALLGACHREAHYDKQEPAEGLQLLNCTFLSTPFGFEGTIVQGLTSHLHSLPIDKVREYKLMVNALEQAITKGLGDTRRPINEVDLWSWSSTVAALFKAGIAGALLDKPATDMRNIQWRLLRISFNGLSFLEHASSIPDLLGRQQALKDALDKVKDLLEYEYPLGNEVYRDENGSAFVVPALEGDDDNGVMIRELVEPPVQDAFHQSPLQGELKPNLTVSTATRNAATLHQELAKSIQPPHAFIDAVQSWWQEEPKDICTVCGLRPQGWGAPSEKLRTKAESRHVCYVCLERRGSRAKDWADPQGQLRGESIWLDEVADIHGKAALLVGRFDLDQWLNGDMVRSMLLICEPDKNHFTEKNPSFARLHRIWQTTQRFWKDVLVKDIPEEVKADQRRLIIQPDNSLALDLGGYQVYDADIGGVSISLVWDSQHKVFFTASGLSRLARRLGTRRSDWSDPYKAAGYVKTRIPGDLVLYESGGYGQRRNRIEPKVTIKSIEIAENHYCPVVKLLAEPESFMALVPADKAMDIVQRIQDRFNREMGKVRNRLPFFLGIVYFDYHQPLFAALDAGRRMLRQELESQEWTVDTLDKVNGSVKIKFENGIKWCVSTCMGDSTTEDKWYPYYEVTKDAVGNPPSGRQKYFKLVKTAENELKVVPGNNTETGSHWVHVDELQPGDVVKVTPARFSSLNLDNSGRRFEVGKQEPLFLEHIDRMYDLWKRLYINKDLKDSELHDLEALFRSKWEEWRLDDSASREKYLDIFKSLIEATLKQKGLSDTIAVTDITEGLFFNVMEVYYHVMQKRLAERTED